MSQRREKKRRKWLRSIGELKKKPKAPSPYRVVKPDESSKPEKKPGIMDRLLGVVRKIFK